MTAVIIKETETLSRVEYWKRVVLLLLGVFLVGIACGFAGMSKENFASVQFYCSLAGWFFGVYWGIPRCRDAGWHPGWAVLNFSIISYIIFGLPKTKEAL